DAQVRLQVAYSLGAWPDERAGRSLAQLALRYADDPHLTAAVLSSMNRKNVAEVLAGVLQSGSQKPPPQHLAEKLVAIAAEIGDENNLSKILGIISMRRVDHIERWQMAALAGLLEALGRKGKSLDQLAGRQQLQPMLAECRTIAADGNSRETDRIAAIGT